MDRAGASIRRPAELQQIHHTALRAVRCRRRDIEEEEVIERAMNNIYPFPIFRTEHETLIDNEIDWTVSVVELMRRMHNVAETLSSSGVISDSLFIEIHNSNEYASKLVMGGYRRETTEDREFDRQCSERAQARTAKRELAELARLKAKYEGGNE